MNVEDAQHIFLDEAKRFNWPFVWSMLATQPDLINAQPCRRWSVLHQAAFFGDVSVTQRLLNLQADPCSLASCDNLRPIDVAGQYGGVSSADVQSIIDFLNSAMTHNESFHGTSQIHVQMPTDSEHSSITVEPDDPTRISEDNFPAREDTDIGIELAAAVSGTNLAMQSSAQ